MYAFSPSSYLIRAMKHERLGSYSIASTVAVTPSLRALEVDDAVELLVAAAAVLGGDHAVWLRPPVFLRRSISVFSGSNLVSSA